MNAMSRFCFAILAVGLLGAAFASAQDSSRSAAADSTIVVNAQLADGSGAPLKQNSVRIRGDRIVQIGNFKPQPGEHVIDAARPRARAGLH